MEIFQEFQQVNLPYPQALELLFNKQFAVFKVLFAVLLLEPLFDF